MPDFLHTDFLPGRTLRVADKEYLYFCGTSYLGMARNAGLQAFLQEGITRYGSNYASTRLSNVQLNIYAEAEDYLVKLTGAEAALTVSSGFLAGQLVIRTLENTAHFIYGPRTHPALWRRQTDFIDGSFTTWLANLPEQIADSAQENILILCNSLDPLWAVKYSFGWLKNLPANKNITVVIDDSHGFGVTGENGAGIISEIAVPPHVELIIVTSLGKALGVPAGLILGKKEQLGEFRRHPFFGSSSPAVPAYLYAFLQAEAVYPAARQNLIRNIQYFSAQLTHPYLLQSFPDYPVFYTPYNQLCPFLFESDILISSFAYPNPNSPLVTRIILNSLHTANDLTKLAIAVNQFAANNLKIKV